ncbi:intermembrane lipid transfer protein VPS13C isoform X2 [Hyla sarda]|uniref:intermembrane lipid transfer protein VPS13C isoform X2 n=1 Tax=Hyla sarda TaxID=327740 RepID=UPI0024C4506A|nr:intermembrane lipid transfer protein VPS13C isoform X2 [Hyla sarda]
MFESVVADLLNRFLGDYVENLDRSQLKLGIWGGNVSLENLKIRENALSELDVPFKVKAGQIDKLILKIPWKNLYGDAVVATLEGLYLLVVPGASIQYDAEKEERNVQEAKQRDLLRIEETLQKAAEKGLLDDCHNLQGFMCSKKQSGLKRKKHKSFKNRFKVHDAKKDKPKEEKKDTFLEKLAAQVIKNLQVKITNIHIRYEDDITDVSIPVSVGMSLAELSLQTSSESWTPSILNEAAKVIYKLVRLDSFSTYWNVNSKLYYSHSRENILENLKSGVMSNGRKPLDYEYIFKPVSASAKLYINPNAELELRTPKLDWNMEVQDIAIELTKPQYLSMIDVLESVDYMVRNLPYRKYRPVVNLKEAPSEWWLYAITSILEVHVRRRTRMWSWLHISQHRENLKNYKNAYKVKLTQTKVPEEITKQIQALEKILDVFNIILARQQAQAEVVRSGQKLLAKKASQTGEKKSGGWFGGFWGKKETSKKEDSEELSVPDKINDLMSPEEKKKLFTAIGYSESSHNLNLPKTYVAHILSFQLVSTSIIIRDNVHAPETLKVQIVDLSTKVYQRPGAQAIKVEAKLDHWYVTGLKQKDIVPSLVSTIGSSESSLLKIHFETNPEDSTADQVLVLQSQPVEIIYDAATINAIADFFQTHKGMDLEQLTSVTLMKLEEIKERTAAGLSHMIETRKILDLRINLQPSYLLIPKTGFYYENSDLIIVDFGSLQLNSINQGSLPAVGTSSLEELMDKAYDKFHVELKKVQMLFSKPGQDWKTARGLKSSSLHILQPLDIDVELSKAMVERDSRMPRFKVSGELPLLRLKISDYKIQGVFELVNSIPLPQSQTSSPTIKEKKIPIVPILTRRPEKLFKRDIEKSLLLEDESLSDSDEEFFDATADVSRKLPLKVATETNKPTPAEETSLEELTDLQLKFEIKEVTLELTKQREEQENTVLNFRIQQLGTEACVKTYDLSVVSYLKKITLDYYDVSGLLKQPLHLISSSDKQGLDLLEVEYIKANKDGPEFHTTFENTEQKLKVAFSSMDLLLHSQALLSAISFITAAVPSITDKAEVSSVQKKQDKGTFVKKATKASKDKDFIAFKLFAKLDSFSMNMWDENKHIAEIKILGLDSSVFLESSQIEVFARLKDIVVNDVNPKTIHKKAVCIMEDEVFNFNLTLYPDATQGDSYKNVSKVDGNISLKVGCIRIVFLNKFLMSFMDFLNNFQTAKEKVSAATAHAAQRAATRVKGLAERSFRLLMDVHLKAPVIVIPQSSTSNNAIVADLGLLKINNAFSLVSSECLQIPPIIDCMTINLTQFKLSREVLHTDSVQSDIQILHPINLCLSVNRNLAATWYHDIPDLNVKGHLNTMDVWLSHEDLSVLFNVLVENLGEGRGGSADSGQTTGQAAYVVKSKQGVVHTMSTKKESGEMSELESEKSSSNLSLLINFEIKKVVVQLMKQVRGNAPPLHIIEISQLGAVTQVGTHEMRAAVYLQKISMTCNEFPGPKGGPLLLINSSDDTDEHLLKMEYIKADSNGPNFRTVHSNTLQTLSFSMTSLNLVLHTQALLSLMNFLSAAVPSSEAKVTEKAKESKPDAEGEKNVITKPDTAVSRIYELDIIDLKLSATLNAFNVFVCDELCNIADIRIQGMDASYTVHAKKKELFARLCDIVVINVDPKTIHQKAVYILGKEVFSLQMTLYPDATEGAAYTNMSAIDSKILLRVGCIHIVYLHKFLMSLLNFMNTFQTAKEAVSSATAQAAEKAASSMKDFAQKTFRLSMDINLKAPVIYIPQSSTSTNVIVADLGLIRVQNTFTLVPEVNAPLPPVIDKMEIQLTELKLSRSVIQNGSPQPELELLQPVNLNVYVQRNLSSSWYSQIPAIQIDGDLKPMQIALSQDDLTILMSVLFENLGETPSLPSASPPAVKKLVKESKVFIQQTEKTGSESIEASSEETIVTTLKFGFNFESLSIVLYNNDNSKVASDWLHNENLRLGELRLDCLSSSGMMSANSSMDFSFQLKTCTLDDLREGLTRATSRMIDQKDASSTRGMIDINYKQTGQERFITAILDKLYVCASVEFLMTVADFFIQAIPQNPSTEKPLQIPARPSTPTKTKVDREELAASKKMYVKALVMDPEIVFVASLAKADAPALAVSFQGNLTLSDINSEKKMTAIIKEFKVLACPFLRQLRGSNITTVIQPCSLHLQNTTSVTGSQNGSLNVDEVIIKISPIILNTVLTIMAALKPKPKDNEEKGQLVIPRNIWDTSTTDNYSSWFLGVDTAHEATECFQNPECSTKEENFDIVVKVVQVTLECGLGHRTVPLLLVESTFTGGVQNWTSFMSVTADTTLEVHYYNELYAVWEPFIERVDNGKHQWNLKLEMKNNPVQEKSLLPGDDFIVVPEPQSAINITSKDTMNITISKCTLGVFSNLAKAFSEGTASVFDYSLKDRAPLIVKNALGVPFILDHGANLRLCGSSVDEPIHIVNEGQCLELEFSSVQSLYRGRLSALHRQESSLFTLGLVPQGYTEITNIPLSKPARRLYNVRSPLQESCVSIVVQIDASEGNKVLFVRSPLQIKNHFSVPFKVYKFVANAKLIESIGVCKPDEEFHVPLHSYRCQLYLKPMGALDGQYKESTTYIMWKEMLHRSNEVQCTLQCPSTEINFLPLVVNCTAVPDEINFITSNGEKDWDPAYIIHLYPSLTIKNLLPYSLRYLLEGTAEAHTLPEGSSCDVLNSRISGEIMELVLIKYQGRNWNGHFRVHGGLPEFFPICFKADSTEVMTTDLSVHVKRIGNRMVLSVFSPYWIINKTSRILQYRAEDIHVKHPSDYRDVILFSFKKKNIFSKNKIQLCISTSSWSSGFSLDTVGSYGCVKCPADKLEYLVGVNIKMSSFNLTRIVTLTPFYTLVNKCGLELEVGEIEADGSLPDMKWHYVATSECVPFWPGNVSQKLCVRVIGCAGSSKPFFFNKQDNGTLLVIESMNTGLLVDVSISDHSIVIKFSDYYEGAAPALIMNHTPRAKLTYSQSGIDKEKVLLPGETRLFAWADPTGTRKLFWTYGQNKGELDLLKDESGQFAYNPEIQIHWVSFLDGRQRVLLFTEDVALVTKARQAEEMEQPDKEINISIHSFGLSLINNEAKQEICYMGITSSGIIWELMPKRKWKPFNQKQILQLEQAYEKYLTGEQCRWTKLDVNFEVSFSSMEMRLPTKCKIRRSFLSGIHVELKESPHQRSLRAQLYWLQVDNQLPGSMFPAVFHPVAPPKSIALDSEPKPFIDISIITRFNEFSKVKQFKYFMVLIQCMALKIDQGFLAAIMELFTPSSVPEVEKHTKLIQKDLDALNTELMESSLTDITTPSFFEHFHISPVKLHLSLSLGSGGETNKEEHELVAISSVNLLLKSIGATLTDVDDLIFKLACFEVQYKFYKQDQLMKLVIRHYSEQFLKQLYVLVFGLDVLGNPYGLIRGLSEGVEAFFYEPFQGAVQGPEEFAEGLVIGVKSLLGHTVGGAAGVVSRITGSVGKGLAAITMDKEYQQKRREEMGRQPKDFGDSLAKGGKGFLRGVVGGVTGIITKPVEGAKKEGAAGFFKGIGKGLVGVVARPTGGIIDMASSTFQGIQRVAESTEDVSPLRPPRFIHEDGIIRPYNQNEAQGLNFFENSNLEKLDGEIYRYSCTLHRNKKNTLVVTNRRIINVKEVEILGHRSIDWDYPFEDFIQPPTVVENVLKLFVKDHSLKVFQKKEDGIYEVKNVAFQSNAAAQMVLRALDAARTSRQQHTLVRQKSEKFIKQYSS